MLPDRKSAFRAGFWPLLVQKYQQFCKTKSAGQDAWRFWSAKLKQCSFLFFGSLMYVASSRRPQAITVHALQIPERINDVFANEFYNGNQASQTAFGSTRAPRHNRKRDRPRQGRKLILNHGARGPPIGRKHGFDVWTFLGSCNCWSDCVTSKWPKPRRDESVAGVTVPVWVPTPASVPVCVYL